MQNNHITLKFQITWSNFELSRCYSGTYMRVVMLRNLTQFCFSHQQSIYLCKTLDKRKIRRINYGNDCGNSLCHIHSFLLKFVSLLLILDNYTRSWHKLFLNNSLWSWCAILKTLKVEYTYSTWEAWPHEVLYRRPCLAPIGF